MRNWYRFANQSALVRDIATWLFQAAQGNVNIATLQDDISMRMGGMDDVFLLNSSVEQASAFVAQRQDGDLLPVQQEIIQAILSRTQNLTEPPVDEPPPEMPEPSPSF